MTKTLQEILNQETPKVVKIATQKANEMLLDIHLRELSQQIKLPHKKITKN